MSFKKWPSIEKFSDVVHDARAYDVTYATFRGKIKLHGTNAAIRVEDGEFIPQKRTSDLTVNNDNVGFARWVSTITPNIKLNQNVVIHGEWAGPGIQKGDAVSQVPNKKFFVFAATSTRPLTEDEKEILGDEIDYNTVDDVVIDPTALQSLVNQVFGSHADIHVLPWQTEEFTVDMTSNEDAERFLSTVTNIVNDEIDKEDPYVKNEFGVSGPGEGLVFYVTDQDKQLFWKKYLFKVKTESHSVNKTKKKNSVVPEKPEGMDEFVEMFFTENRFKQMLNEHFDGVANKKDTGKFLGTVMQDVSKESVNELALADFEWKVVTKHATPTVRGWFLKEAEKIG